MARSFVAKARLPNGRLLLPRGKSEVVRPTPNGAMILVNVLHPGDWGGIMGLAGKMQRLARLSARGDITIRAIDHNSLVKLMDELPGLSSALLATMGQRIRDDAAHLSATLQHVGAVGLEDVAAHCSPHERVMLDTIRHRVAAAESLSQIMDFVFDSIPHEDDLRMTLVFLADAAGPPGQPMVACELRAVGVAGKLRRGSRRQPGGRIVSHVGAFDRESSGRIRLQSSLQSGCGQTREGRLAIKHDCAAARRQSNGRISGSQCAAR